MRPRPTSIRGKKRVNKAKSKSSRRAPPPPPFVPPVAIMMMDERDIKIGKLEQKIEYLEQKLSNLLSRVYADGQNLIPTTTGDIIIQADKNIEIESYQDTLIIPQHDLIFRADNVSADFSTLLVEVVGDFDVTCTEYSVICSTINLEAGSLSASVAYSSFSGALKADSIQAKNVIGSTYTPGAGIIF